MPDSNRIPKGWEMKTLNEICTEIFAGGDVPKNNFSKIKTEEFSIPIFANGEKNVGLYGYTDIIKVNSPALTISGRGTIGFSVVRLKPFFPIVRLLVLKPNVETDIKYLKYSIDNCNIKHTGSSIPQLTVPTVKKIKIPIPSLQTQQAIVSKIEELFSELDKGIEDLKIAQQQLKIYRQSVLKWAFEGKLTSENIKDGKLPKGWMKLKIGEFGKVKGGKRLPKGHTYSENLTKFPYLRVTDFGNQTIHISKLKYLYPETQLAIKNYIISKNDVFISIAGTIGEVGTIPEKLDGANLTENAAKITELKNVNNKYLSQYLSSTEAQSQIKNKTKTTTQPKLSLYRIEDIDVPVPPIEEQHRIVQEIENRLSVADKMEESITQSLQQAETLRQSILKKAFSGELV